MKTPKTTTDSKQPPTVYEVGYTVHAARIQVAGRQRLVQQVRLATTGAVAFTVPMTADRKQIARQARETKA